MDAHLEALTRPLIRWAAVFATGLVVGAAVPTVLLVLPGADDPQPEAGALDCGATVATVQVLRAQIELYRSNFGRARALLDDAAALLPATSELRSDLEAFDSSPGADRVSQHRALDRLAERLERMAQP